MLTVPTALLLHRTREASHYDWLVGTPAYYARASSGLWTARVGRDSRLWRGLGCFDLEPIAEHRRAYLDYQGPVSGDRGSVVRVDRGSAVIYLWSQGRIIVDLRMAGFEGRVEMAQDSTWLWRARIIA